MPDRHGANPDGAGRKLLDVTGLRAFYGESQVLHGIDFHVRQGEIVTLLGRNGAGKTSTLRAIMGLVARTGSIRFEGQEIAGWGTEAVARAGIAYVPEERAIFSSLSVAENLVLPPVIKPGGMTKERIYTLFPNLRERQGNQGTKLSGGEQQMLAIARVLRTGASFILMDEPTEGLAPVIVRQIEAVIRELKGQAYTILLVEQNFHFAKSVADRHYLFEEGWIAGMVDNSELDDPAVLDRMSRVLGV